MFPGAGTGAVRMGAPRSGAEPGPEAVPERVLPPFASVDASQPAPQQVDGSLSGR